MVDKNKKVVVIGGGLSGLSASSILSRKGFDVQLLEKNSTYGGRINKFTYEGFTFDMGPSWYWMPDVFESFYNEVGRTTKDFYTLKRLDPSYRIFLKDDLIDIPADWNELKVLFERIEPGSSGKLEHFMSEAEVKYIAGIHKLVYNAGLSPLEYLKKDLIQQASKIDLFRTFHHHVSKYFSSPVLHQLLEFPILFLGATGKHIPSLYSLMNYADMKLGTWYPMGGMSKVADAFHSIALENGVRLINNEAIASFDTKYNQIQSITTNRQNKITAQYFLATADYHHIESLLSAKHKSYSNNYWETRKMAPSCLLYFVGVNKKIKSLLHHNLFFDTDYQQHVKQIFDTNEWPEAPLFYVCAPSVTDESVAPPNHENLFILIPVAPGLADTPETRESIFQNVITRIEKHTNCQFQKNVVLKKHFGHAEYTSTYNAFKGNAYGLANTLMQTAFLKPKMKSKKLKNLYYAGQLTNPGPGMPPAIISGRIAADLIIKATKSILND